MKFIVGCLENGLSASNAVTGQPWESLHVGKCVEDWSHVLFKKWVCVAGWKKEGLSLDSSCWKTTKQPKFMSLKNSIGNRSMLPFGYKLWQSSSFLCWQAYWTTESSIFWLFLSPGNKCGFGSLLTVCQTSCLFSFLNRSN